MIASHSTSSVSAPCHVWSGARGYARRQCGTTRGTAAGSARAAPPRAASCTWAPSRKRARPPCALLHPPPLPGCMPACACIRCRRSCKQHSGPRTRGAPASAALRAGARAALASAGSPACQTCLNTCAEHGSQHTLAVQRVRPRGAVHPRAQRGPELPGHGLCAGRLHAGALRGRRACIAGCRGGTARTRALHSRTSLLPRSLQALVA